MTTLEIDDEPEEFVTIETIDPFDSLGNVRKDIDQEIIAALPPQRRAFLIDLIAKSEAMEAAEAILTASIKNVGECARTQATAQDKLGEARPVVTHQDAAAAAAYAHRTGKSIPVDRNVQKRINAAAAVVDQADAALTQAHKNHQAAKRSAQMSREEYFAALTAWSANSGPRPDQKMLIQAVAATNAAREQHARSQIAAQPASHLDALLRVSARQGRMGRATEFPGKVPLLRTPPSAR